VKSQHRCDLNETIGRMTIQGIAHIGEPETMCPHQRR
jgi:hypothetical protein